MNVCGQNSLTVCPMQETATGQVPRLFKRLGAALPDFRQQIGDARDRQAHHV